MKMTYAVPSLFVLSAALSGCGAQASGESASSTGGDRLDVVAAFYPLQLAAERVGGAHVSVTGLTKPGAEPHDLELTPREVARLGSARSVIYLKGFQPAVDEAVTAQAPRAGFDVSTAARLTLSARADGHDHGGEHGDEHAAEEHAGEARDPHFWLDPQRYAKVVRAIAADLATKDPTHAAAYDRNADAMVTDLTALDKELAAGLASCRSKDLVTGHAAFGYLAERYGLKQESIAGISPDAEPNAAAMRELTAHVREHDVTTVYAETLVSPALTQTLAREAGAKVAVLDPVEGITKDSAGQDYFAVMRANLATLRTGQQCQ